MADVLLGDQTYENVEAVKLNTPDGGTVTFYQNGGGGSSGLSAQADWAEENESASSFIKNKPFGVPLSTTTVNYNEDGEVISEMNMFRIGDAPTSIYDLTGAHVKYYENDVLKEGKVYPSLMGFLDDKPEDFADYGCVIIDYSSVYSSMYILTCGNDNAQAFVATADTNVEGLAIPAGIYAQKAQDSSTSTYSWVESITYTVYSKLDRKHLPDDLGSSSGGGGSGAYFIDLTTLIDSSDKSFVLGGDTSSHVFEGTWGSNLKSAIESGQPIVVKTNVAVGEIPVYLVGSITYESGPYPAAEFSGMFAYTVDSLTNVYKFRINFVIYGSNGVIVTHSLEGMADSLVPPASNIKYVDFGSSTVDLTKIDYTKYVAGDMILCLKDVT